MKIVLFGASGMIGGRILDEALRRRHEMTAVARDLSKIESRPSVHAVSADIQNPNAVNATAKGQDAIISAFGPRNEGADSLLKATHALIQGAVKAGVKRLIAVGGAGSLKVASGTQLMDTPNFPSNWKDIAEAHLKAQEIYQNEASSLDWTVVSPAAIIEPGERTGKFRTGSDELIADDKGESRISAEDFAIAVLDELEYPKHIRQRFTVGY